MAKCSRWKHDKDRPAALYDHVFSGRYVDRQPMGQSASLLEGCTLREPQTP